MEPSATSTTVTGPVRERLQAGTEDAPVLERLAPLKHLHDSGVGYKYRDLLTYFLTSHLTILMCVLRCGRYLAGAIVAGLSFYAALRYNIGQLLK